MLHQLLPTSRVMIFQEVLMKGEEANQASSLYRPNNNAAILYARNMLNKKKRRGKKVQASKDFLLWSWKIFSRAVGGGGVQLVFIPEAGPEFWWVPPPEES